MTSALTIVVNIGVDYVPVNVNVIEHLQVRLVRAESSCLLNTTYSMQ